jgi:arabinofuranan 3-O-arabinosyltransferase
VRLRSGRASFPPVRTSQLTIEVLEAEAATDLAFDGSSTSVPVGITELRLEGLPYLPLLLPDSPRTTACGEGPSLQVGALEHRTRVTYTPRDVAAGAPARAELCGSEEVELDAGRTEIQVEASTTFAPDSLVLGELSEPAPASRLRTTMPDDATRTISTDADGYVVVRENANPGWVAEQSGTTATPVVFDGWRQAWAVSGEGDLRARFAPDSPYRAALGLGALALVLLLVLAVLPARSRTRHAPVDGRRPPARVALVGLLVAAGVIGGTVGVAAAALGAGLAVAARRLVPRAALLLLSLPLAASAAAYVVRPWGSSAGWAGELAWPQLCTVVALASFASWATLESSGTFQRSDRRMNGSSTNR